MPVTDILLLDQVRQFLKRDLEESWLLDKSPLAIEFNGSPATSQKEAISGDWAQVSEGYSYGPAYRTVWFRVSGKIPRAWQGKPVYLRANVANERTLWMTNSPEVGLDGKHQFIKLTDRILQGCTNETGDPAFYFEAYTGNPMDVWLTLPVPERKPEVETVGETCLCLVDEDTLLLRDTVTFAHDLARALPETDHGRQILIHDLDRVVLDYRRGVSSQLLVDRIKATLTQLGGAPPHALFPVGHAHLDSAWLWPVSITKQKMAHTTANQLTLIDQYPEYVFCHSQPSQYVWLEEQHPELFQRVQEASKRGQWEVVGGMWVESDCNLAGAESIVRQFLYGIKYVEQKFQRKTHEVWLPDCFGFPGSLPQIFKGFGLNHFLTSKMYWSESNHMPHHIYRWAGIDGSEVTAHHPPTECYTCTPLPKVLLEAMANYKDPARCQGSLLLYGYGDGGGGPTREHLEYLRLASQTSRLPVMKQQVNVADYFKFTEDNAKNLALWEGELYLEFHRGTLTSQAANKAANRRSEQKLRDLEWLIASQKAKPAKELTAQVESVWKRVLFNQFHDILPGTSVVEVYEDTAREYEQIDSELDDLIERQLSTFASSPESLALFQNSTIKTQAAVPIEAVPSSAFGAIQVGDELLSTQTVELFGKSLTIFETPSAILQSAAEATFVQAADVPSPFTVSVTELRSQQWSLKLDKNGHIVSLVDLSSGQEFLDPSEPCNIFELYEDVPNSWSAWNVERQNLRDPLVLAELDSIEVVETGPVRAAVEITRSFGKSKLVQRISLGPTPGIRCDVWVDWQETEKLLKVAFPVQVRSRHARYDIQFGSIERPTHRNTTWDEAMFEVCAHKWVDLSEAGRGVAILNESKYGHDVHANVIRLSLLRATVAPDPRADIGEHTFSYSIFPHIGDFRTGGVVAAAYAFNSSTRSALAAANTTTPGEFLSPRVTDDSLVIETLKTTEDGQGTIVRIYECHGSRGTSRLNVPSWVRSAHLCDLNEVSIQELELQAGTVALSYEPFKILTVRLSS